MKANEELTYWHYDPKNSLNFALHEFFFYAIGLNKQPEIQNRPDVNLPLIRSAFPFGVLNAWHNFPFDQSISAYCMLWNICKSKYWRKHSSNKFNKLYIYCGTPLYGHPLNTDTPVLRTVLLALEWVMLKKWKELGSEFRSLVLLIWFPQNLAHIRNHIYYLRVRISDAHFCFAKKVPKTLETIYPRVRISDPACSVKQSATNLSGTWHFLHQRYLQKSIAQEKLQQRYWFIKVIFNRSDVNCIFEK